MLDLIALRVGAPLIAGKFPNMTPNGMSNIVTGLICTLVTNEMFTADSVLCLCELSLK